jgi:hypothetical protein
MAHIHHTAEDTRTGLSMGMMIGLILGLILVVALVFAVIGQPWGNADDTDRGPDINPPVATQPANGGQ